MFILKPSSFHQLLLALAIALFSLMVVASPVGTTHPPEGAPPTDIFVIQLGRKKTGSDGWLPNSVDFAKDQDIILFIGNHLLKFQPTPEPHIIHQEQSQSTLPDPNHLIQLGPNRQSNLRLIIRPDETNDFWARITNIPNLGKEVRWRIKDDLDYNYGVMTVLVQGWGDRDLARKQFGRMTEWNHIISVMRDLKEDFPVSIGLRSANPML
ncbi:hypothetical protein F5890DRAFT_1559707 [Lentinula detonsa]|uniref:Uncharacterized protein n=1 Tax=Lentinula detonsa TaxID=2804962 RepID=A0AA38PP76_9AGAR|nr:hypothetical protein F5890DRAFT_1559707 [Lentinula detonsa]